MNKKKKPPVVHQECVCESMLGLILILVAVCCDRVSVRMRPSPQTRDRLRRAGATGLEAEIDLVGRQVGVRVRGIEDRDTQGQVRRVMLRLRFHERTPLKMYESVSDVPVFDGSSDNLDDSLYKKEYTG